MHEVARRVRLVRDPGRLPALAEVGELAVDVDLAPLGAEERVVEAEAPLEHARRPFGAEGRETRGQHRAVGRPRRVHRLRRRPVLEVGEEPAGERAGDAERARCLSRVAAREAHRCRRAAEDAADRGRVEAPLVERAGRGHADTRDDLVAGHDRGQQLSSVGAVRFADGGSHRHDDRAHVGHGVGVRVVVVEAVAEHRVREGCARSRNVRAVPDHRRLRIPSQLRHGRAAFGRDAERARSEPAAERVEHVELRRLDHVGRDVVVRERRREVAMRSAAVVMTLAPTVQSVSVPGNVSRTSSASRR